jgi:hypothetical protein
MRLSQLVLVGILLSGGGCAQAGAFLQGYAQGAAGAPAVAPAIAPSSPPLPAGLLIFGGRNHDVFLGCLTCSEFDSSSARNELTYGSAFSSTSFHNHFSDYGSEFSSTSACNLFASHPPVVVDNQGRYYGELTVSTTNPRAIKSPTIRAWLAGICQ